MPQTRHFSKLHISLDSWAVITALLAALLVRSGFLKSVPW
jgi:cytochrome c biogenesis factor